MFYFMSKSSFLGTQKISLLLFKQSLPAMIGMIVMSLYFLVDSIFVGRAVGPLGLAGISITFPLHILIMAISFLIGIGMSSIISRAFGAKKIVLAEKALGNYVSLILIAGLITTLFFYIFLEPLLKLVGSSPQILPFAITYMGIVLISNPIFLIFSSGNNIIRSVGFAKLSMFLMLTSALLNLVLDPIFIFVYGWGISGAAWATVISQIVAGVICFWYIVSGRLGVKFYFKNLFLDLGVVKESFSIGFSSFSRQIVGAIVISVLNVSLAFYGGDLGVASFGVANRIFLFCMMPLLGIVQGLMPIVGYNYGAKNFDRVKSAVYVAIRYSTFFSLFFFVVVMFFAETIVKIFTKDVSLIIFSAFGVRLMFLLIITMGFQTIVGGFLQALGKGVPAFFISVQKYIFLLPLIFILPLFFGFNGLWYSYAVADCLSFFVSFFIFRKEIKTLKIISDDK